MKKEYDFSQGEQGRFYQENSTLHLPIYLEPDVEKVMQALAESTGQNVNDLVNSWLRNNIAVVHSVQPAQ